MIGRAPIIFTLCIIILSLAACPFEADKRMMEEKVTVDINVRYNGTVVYHGYGFYIGVVSAGETKDFTFTIENIGYEGSLILTGSPAVTVSGDGFTVLRQPAKTSLSPGESTTFTIRFAPAETQPYEGIVSIPNNDHAEAEYTFALIGENYRSFHTVIGKGVNP